MIDNGHALINFYLENSTITPMMASLRRLQLDLVILFL